MSKIIEVKNAVLEFLKESINSYEVTVIKLEKVNEIWEAVAEVYEDDSFLKSMNLPPKQVRLYYSVHLDDNLEITSFQRITSFEETGNNNQ
ncbi:MAG: gas vesicle protein [Bacteroidetes bacterium]|nr:gas vesicle protein [Bacteroidota bacterium]